MTNEEINRAIAAIAGWTEIENWNTSATKKTYIGTNATHPELGKFIPNYVESLDAIIALLDQLDLNYEIMRYSKHDKVKRFLIVFQDRDPEFKDAEHPFYPWHDNLSLGLCKLLLAINPDPIKPNVAIIDDDGDVEPTVFEAEFV
jgi:hypothetical protein